MGTLSVGGHHPGVICRNLVPQQLLECQRCPYKKRFWLTQYMSSLHNHMYIYLQNSLPAEILPALNQFIHHLHLGCHSAIKRACQTTTLNDIPVDLGQGRAESPIAYLTMSPTLILSGSYIYIVLLYYNMHHVSNCSSYVSANILSTQCKLIIYKNARWFCGMVQVCILLIG